MAKIIAIIASILALLVAGYGLERFNAEENEGGEVVETSENTENTGSTESNSGPRLNLSNQGLTTVPSSVFSQTSLVALDVSHNNLTGALQAEVRHLQNLRVLDLSDNEFTGVPAEIGQLRNLEVLDLSNNKLTGLPYELGNLSNLKELDLSGNAYSPADLDVIKKALPASVVIKTVR